MFPEVSYRQCGMFYFFDEIASTIDEARDPKYGHGDVIAAEYQTAGRGQRGNKWSSAAGQNLMFSVVLDTSFLKVTEQFLLLQTVALALADTFAEYGIDARIKWTNDIYIGDRKITGVLIDHSIKDGMLARSGVGIGINVNQTEFEDWLPNPTSMALETGREQDRREVLDKFYGALTRRYGLLKNGGRDEIRNQYHDKIYRLDTPAPFTVPGVEGQFTGIIRRVEPDGGLVVEDVTGHRNTYLFQQINFVI